MKVDFKSRKLKSSIIKITDKVKDNPSLYKDHIVYGVTKDEGIALTGNVTSDDLSEYIVVGENTFAFNPYRVNIGSIGLSEKNFKGLVSPAYVVFKTKKDLLPEFLFSFLKSDTGIKLINWYGNRGGVRNALRFDDLGEMDIPDLTVDEQRIALKKITIAKRKLESVNDELDFQQTHLKQLRQAILQEAVQGKLTKQNPKDEPASKLLQRIKAEKQKLIAEGKLKNEKELLPITKDEIPFELPKGWVWCRLNEVAKQITDGEHLTPPRVAQGFRLLSAKNVRDGFINYENCDFVTKEVFEKCIKRCKPEIGDLLIISVGGTIGRTSLITKDIPFVIVRSVAMIKPIIIDSNYLRIVMNSPLLQGIIANKSRGGAQPCLYLTEIQKFVFPLPPLSEQQRIVTKVEQLMQVVNQLEQQVQQSQQQAGQLLQAVLKEAFSSTGEASKKESKKGKEYKMNEEITLAAEE